MDLGTAPERDPALTTPKSVRMGQLAVRARISSPVLQALVALGVYLTVWVIARTYPLVLHPTQPQLNPSAQDPNFFIWCLRWWPYAIAHGLDPIHTTEVLAPSGYDLAWITAIPALSLLVTPLTAAAGPVVSYNLLAAVSLPVSAWAAFVLCRRLTGRFWPALLGGAIYGFSAYETSHMVNGTLNLIFVPLLPLMAYLVVLWRDRKLSPRAFVGLLALAIVVQFYLYLEIFADMTAVWAVALLLGYVLADRGSRPVVAGLSRLVGLAYLLALVFIGPYVVYAVSHVPPGGLLPLGPAYLDLANLVVPRHGQTLGLSWLAGYSARMPIASGAGYVGVPLLALAVALAVFTWSRKLTRLLFLLLVFLTVVSLGPALYVGGSRVIGLPWAHLWSLPIVRSAWPVRVMLFSFLVLAVMVALWLAGPSKRIWARWSLGLLAIASVVMSIPALSIASGANLPAFIATGEYRHYLAPGDTVVVVSQRGNAGMLWQAETDFYMRLAGGYINGAITPHSDLPRAVARLARPTQRNIREFSLFLKKAHVAAVLVEESTAPDWAGVLTRLGLRGRAVGGVIVYPTAARAPTKQRPSP